MFSKGDGVIAAAHPAKQRIESPFHPAIMRVNKNET
jgi:hypothetical protein